MSFEIICENCAAPSSPSVGLCPYCKAIMTTEESKKLPAFSKLKTLYKEGKSSSALFLAKTVLEQDKKYSEDPSVLLICAKIMIETEGPNSKVKSLLARAYVMEPENGEISDYMELVDAKYEMSRGNKTHGREMLTKILRRSPNHVHAHFLLGAHLYWDNSDPYAAIPHLEKCLILHPNFLRAWACLATIARKIGNTSLAERALRRCLELESGGSMKQYFEKLMAETKGVKSAA